MVVINPNPVYWENLPAATIKEEELEKVIRPILDTLTNYKRSIREQSPIVNAVKRDISVVQIDFSINSDDDMELEESNEVLANSRKFYFKNINHVIEKRTYQIEEQIGRKNQALVSPPLREKNSESITLGGYEVLVRIEPVDGIYIEFEFSSDEQKGLLKKALQHYGTLRVIADSKPDNRIKQNNPFLSILQYYADEDAALIKPAQIPDRFEIQVQPNISVIEKKIKAILSFVERPKNYFYPLSRLFERSFNDNPSNDDLVIKDTIPKGEFKYLSKNEYPGVDQQRDFVNIALGTRDFAILEGPPGSGKTTTILEILHQATKRNQRVLLVASTHIAVDNVIERIDEEREKGEELQILPIRIGEAESVTDVAEDYILDNLSRKESGRMIRLLKNAGLKNLSAAQKKLLNFLERDDSQFKSFLLEIANVVCGTTIGILRYPAFDLKEFQINEPFDIMIIDEASKTTFQEFLVPALLAKKWIIIGDKMQLSPFIEEGEVKTLKDRCFIAGNFEEDHQWLCSEYLSATEGNAVLTDVNKYKALFNEQIARSGVEGIALLSPYRQNDPENDGTRIILEGSMWNREIFQILGCCGCIIDYRILVSDKRDLVLSVLPAELELVISPHIKEQLEPHDIELLEYTGSIHSRRMNAIADATKTRFREGQIKSWVDNLAWRLKRLYELRHEACGENEKSTFDNFSREIEMLLPKWPLAELDYVGDLNNDEVWRINEALRVKAFNLVLNFEPWKSHDMEDLVQSKIDGTDLETIFTKLREIYLTLPTDEGAYFIRAITWLVINKRQNQWISAFQSHFPEFFEDLLTFEVGNQVYDTLRIEYPSIIELLQEGLMVEPKYRNSIVYNCTIYKGYEAKKSFWKTREVKLEYQHRMHPHISKFIREHFYEGKQVRDPDGTNDTYNIELKRKFLFRPGYRNVWYHVNGEEIENHGFTNQEEIECVYDFYREFEKWAGENPKPKERPKDNGIWEVGIITFYLGQRGELSRKFQKHFKSKSLRFSFKDENKNVKLKICTVDSFQGQEADLVLLSLVRTHRVGFLDSRNRLNVALSRAKYCQVVFGKKTFFKRDFVKTRSPILYDLANELPSESKLSDEQ
jgi:superfamily I DNA and/or RNA helicase